MNPHIPWQPVRSTQTLAPKRIATETFTDASPAVARLEEIYGRNTAFLRERFESYLTGEPVAARVRATYPFVRITTDTYARVDSRLSYGFVSGPGTHETTVTRPDLFRGYLSEQIRLLLKNHGVPVEVGESDEPIPVHFAYRQDINLESGMCRAPKVETHGGSIRLVHLGRELTSPIYNYGGTFFIHGSD